VKNIAVMFLTKVRRCPMWTTGSRYKSSRWRQFVTVLWRSSLTNRRDPLLLRGRLSQALVYPSYYHYSPLPICINYTTCPRTIIDNVAVGGRVSLKLGVLTGYHCAQAH